MKRISSVVLKLIILLLAIYPLATWWFVREDSWQTIVDVAYAGCVEHGLPVQCMMVTQQSGCPGTFGFGGRATIDFSATGWGPWPDDQPRVLRVELHRYLNLMGWKVVRISDGRGRPLYPVQAQ